MVEDRKEVYRIDDVADKGQENKRLLPTNFKIWDLVVLTLIIAFAFGLQIPDVVYILVAAAFIAISCVALLLVYCLTPMSNRRRMDAEDFFQRLLFKTLWLCVFAIIFCSLSLILKTTFGIGVNQSWDEVIKSMRKFS